MPAPDRATRTLADEQRGVARARILRAARAVLAEKGLDTTVDDVAAAADVSRRTVFRHFESRDRLLAEALRDARRSYAQGLASAVDRIDTSVDPSLWLRELLVAAHHLNAGNGRIYWELSAPGAAPAGELGEAAAERRAGRQLFAARVASAAWRARGGTDEPPGWLVDAFAVHLSAFTTQSLSGDFGRTPDDVADVSMRVLDAALDAALEAAGKPAVAAPVGAPR